MMRPWIYSVVAMFTACTARSVQVARDDMAAPKDSAAEQMAADLHVMSALDDDAGSADADGAADGASVLSPRLAFVSNRTGSYNVYTIDVDGTSVQQLTNESSNQLFPAWSPDRSTIVYASDRLGLYGLYSRNVQSGIESPVPTGLASATSPCFSPDGTLLVFEGRTSETAMPDIYKVAANGGTATQLTTDPALDVGPAYGPNGQFIVFISQRTGTYQAFSMGTDGSNQAALTSGATILGKAAISPDSLTIAFARQLSNQTSAIFLHQIGSGQEMQLTNMNDSEATFSPDGVTMAITSARFGNPQVMTISLADASLVTRVTNDTALDGEAAFSQ